MGEGRIGAGGVKKRWWWWVGGSWISERDGGGQKREALFVSGALAAEGAAECLGCVVGWGGGERVLLYMCVYSVQVRSVRPFIRLSVHKTCFQIVF